MELFYELNVGISFSTEECEPLKLRPTDKDLLYIGSQIGVRVDVDDVVYNLIGEISSSSNNTTGEDDGDLENYLLTTNFANSCYQVMARTKQTERKEQQDCQQLSAGGQHLALGNQWHSPRLLDSGDSLDPYEVFDSVLDKGGMGKRGKTSPQKRLVATGFTSDEGSVSGGSGRKCHRIVSEDEDENQDNTPASPPPQRTPTKGKPGCKIIKSKALQKKPSKPRKEMTMKELCADWNRKACVGIPSEMTQGWLKKTEKKREGQRWVLKRARPGMRALKEIRHYQRCQTFLIPVLLFQCLVREVSINSLYAKEGLRWQSNVLFSLQSSTEAYMAGYFHDVHLCTLHRKVKTINRQDIWLAINICGREHIGGKPQVADVGASNISGFTIADASEKKTAP